MPSKSERDLTRISCRVFTDDLEYIREIAAVSGTKVNLIIRSVLGAYVRQTRDRERTRIDALNVNLQISKEDLELAEVESE